MDVLAEEAGELASSDPTKVAAALLRLISVFSSRDPSSLIFSLPALAKLVISSDNRNVRLVVYQVYRRITVTETQWGPIIPFAIRDCTGEDLELQIAAIRLLEEMFRTQLSFILLFKSGIVTVRRAAARALHTLLINRNMTAVIPNFVARHSLLLKDVMFEDPEVAVFYECTRVFADLLPELIDQTAASLDAVVQPSKLHGDLGSKLAEAILPKMQLFMLRLSHLPVSDRGSGLVISFCLVEYQKIAAKGDRAFTWDYPYPITSHIPDIVDTSLVPLLFCRDPAVVYTAAMSICKIACKLHPRRDWIELSVAHLTGLLQQPFLSSLQRYRLLSDILSVLHLVESGDFYESFHSLLRATQLIDGLAERVEVLASLFRVAELKNAHRAPGPSCWDRLFKDAWFASIWNAEDSETFRHEIVIGALEGFRALDVLPGNQRIQYGMEMLTALAPCLFWSSLPVEKKPETDKKEDKKDAEKTVDPKIRAAEEAVSDPRLSQQMYLRLLSSLLPFVANDKAEMVMGRILEGLDKAKSDALCAQLCLFLASMLPESMVAQSKDTSRVDMLVVAMSKRFLTNPTIWADLTAQQRRHFTDGKLAEQISDLLLQDVTQLSRKPHEVMILGALHQLAVRSATPAYVATHLQDLVEIYRDSVSVEKRSARLLYQLRKQRDALRTIHAESKRQLTDDCFAPSDNVDRPFSAKTLYDDNLLLQTLRISSGLNLRTVAHASVDAQRAALTYRVISGSSDPLLVSAAHLANPYTRKITVLLKVENLTLNDVKHVTIYPAVSDPLQFAPGQTLLRVWTIPADKPVELNTSFFVCSLGIPSFSFRINTSDPPEANPLDGYQAIPTFQTTSYIISINQLLSPLHVEAVNYAALWNRCSSAFVTDVSLPKGSKLTSLSAALEKQPFSLVATRTYANAVLASYAAISWFDTIILFNFSQSALPNGSFEARLEFRGTDATGLASFQECAGQWIAALMPGLSVAHRKHAALTSIDASPIAAPTPADMAARYQAARSASGLAP